MGVGNSITAVTASSVPANNYASWPSGAGTNDTVTTVTLPNSSLAGGATGYYLARPGVGGSVTAITTATANKTGWIACVLNSGASLLPMTSIASGTWTITFNWITSIGYTGATWFASIRAYQTDAAMSTMTAITLPGQDATTKFVDSAALGAGTSGTATITLNSTGAVTFAGSTPYLYFEVAAHVTVLPTLTTANWTPANTGMTVALPAVVYARGPSESNTTTDAVTRGGSAFARTISESLSAASDAVTRIYGAARGPSETLTAADVSVTRRFVGARAVSESVGPATDSVARSQGVARNPSETVGPAADAVTRVRTAVRNVSESVGPASDSVARTAAFNRSVAESVGTAADSVSRVLVFRRTVGETVGPVVDSVARTALFSRIVSENLTSGGGGTTVISPLFIFDD